ncbi:MAG: hypothetical protein B7X11_01570, partial [Acidobacteria bacterium 37-65-4]
MKRTTSFLVVTALVLSSASFLHADVKTQHKTSFKLEGMLGGLLNRFAGDAAKDGLIRTTAVKGSRQLRGTPQQGKIIDLAEEKVYDLDMRKKEYRVTTFAELRQAWQDAQAKAQQDAKSASKEDQPTDPQQSGKQYEVSVSVKETGQSKAVAGYNAREVVVTITLHEKGKTLDAGGGMELINTMWIAPKIAALDEITQFDTKFYKAVYGNMLAGADPAQMSMLLASYPSFKDLSEKMSGELKKLQGTPLATTMELYAVKSPEDMAAAPQDKPSGGGLMGRLASRMGPKPKASEARSKVFTSSDEVVSIDTT